MAILSCSRGLCGRSWAERAYVGGLGLLLGPMLAGLGRSWSLCCRSWAALGAYVGSLGPMLAVLAALGAYVVGPGPRLGPILAVLGRSWGLSWRSWALLGPPKAVLGRDQGEKRPKPGKVAQTRAGTRSAASGGGPGPLLGPPWAVLGRCWGLWWRSWALSWRAWPALGAYVGGLGRSWPLLGPLLGPMLAVLGRLGA